MKYNIYFQPKKDARYPVYSFLRMRVLWKDNEIALNTGYRIDITKWSKDTQMCKRNSSHADGVTAATINAYINKLRSLVERLFEQKENWTKDELRNAINTDIRPEKVKKDTSEEYTLWQDSIDFQKEKQLLEWSPSTARRHKSIHERLKDWRPDLRYEDINEQFFHEYVNWALTVEHNINRTVIFKQTALKVFFHWAQAKGRPVGNMGKKIMLKNPDREICYLSWDELMLMYNYDFSEQPSLDRARDCFCFQCFTSLRYSDIVSLKWGNISRGKIHVTTIKTSEPLTIELNKYSQAILDKYKDKDKPLPTLSVNHYNSHIREAAKICGINEPFTRIVMQGNKRVVITRPKYEVLSSHDGRRTFICNALILGIPATTVMKWTGHADYNAMRPYIGVTDKAKEQAMNLFNQR